LAGKAVWTRIRDKYNSDTFSNWRYSVSYYGTDGQPGEPGQPGGPGPDGTPGDSNIPAAAYSGFLTYDAAITVSKPDSFNPY
jgi:hypothetical protein